MNRRLTGRALAGAAAALVLAGGGVAVAAGTGSKSSTTPGATTAPGGTTTAPTPSDRPDRPGFPGPRGPGGPGFGGPGLEFGSAAADYLGLELEELRERVADGRSLAEIARAEGKSVDGLEEALVAAFREHVDELVTATPPRRPELGRGFPGKRGDWHHGPWDRDGRADRAESADRDGDRTP
jgi:hypothetical protein